MQTSRKPIPLDLRNQILREYLSGSMSASDIAFHYGISPKTISVWVHRHVTKSERYVSLLHGKVLNEDNMSRKVYTNPSEETEILRREVRTLRQQLRQVQLEKLALKTLVDIAEEQGICLRKKSGAKQ